MLPKAVEQLLLDVAKCLDELERRAFGYKDEGHQKMARKDPVAVLVSILERIKKHLPEVSATLHDPVDSAFFKEAVEKARKLIEESEREPVAAR